jgi:ABC-2 type transport system ATP-binding protein
VGVRDDNAHVAAAARSNGHGHASATLDTEGLTRRFGALTAVDGLTLTVTDGEVFGLLGPNGAGKSTAIKMLVTLLPPSGGTARVGGLDVVREATAVRRIIGYVPQVVSADGGLTGYENLLVSAKLYDVPGVEREKRIGDALEFMGLTEPADRLVKTYSGGMIRRLEIAQAVLHRPRVLFLDEPTVGLDPLARRALWEHIEGLRAEFGTTVILTTHYMEEADRLCDRVAIMHRGRVAAVGRPADLREEIGGGSTTLDDVFAHYTASSLEPGGTYGETVRRRRTARRLG